MKTKLGLILGGASYLLWGTLPLYWKQLAFLDSYLVFSFRIIATVLTMLVYMLVSRSTVSYERQMKQLFANPKQVIKALAAGFLIACNWLVYIWAVSHGFATEASLGYYMMPLFSVLLAFLFLGEKLSRLKWLAIACAFIGVSWMVLRSGTFPWISLILALSFALYGLLKKESPLSSDLAMLLEAGVILPFAALYLLLGTGERMAAIPWSAWILLSLTGMITIIPLLLFAEALKRAPLNLIGFIQYLNPSLQLILAIFVFGESVSPGMLVGLAWIWLALVIFTIGQFRES